jgi:predicted metal-binding protein
MTYIAGRFQPTPENAQAIVEYFEMYLASETGQVPYRSWPSAMKGHFIARTPPFD